MAYEAVISTDKFSNGGWVVQLAGKTIRWMSGSMESQESDAKHIANKFNESMKTAREMALTPHNLDRRGNIATTLDGVRWVWLGSCEKWAMT